MSATELGTRPIPPRALDPYAGFEQLIESAAVDHSSDAGARSAKLRAIREQLSDLIGRADTYLADSERLREAEASEAARHVLWVRANADVREQMIEAGELTAAQADEQGLLSHAELDELEVEGLLLEAAFGLAKKFEETLHPRGRGGTWIDKPGGDMPSGPSQAVSKPSSLAGHEFVDHLPTGRTREPLVHGPAGTAPEHDEMVLRAHADHLATKAEVTERDVTPLLKDVISGVQGASLEGLDQRLKSRASIVSKIKRKREKMPLATDEERAASITDTVRYTAVFPAGSYNTGVEATLKNMQEKGFQVEEHENYWGGGDDYDGLHVGFASPGGARVEVQFHTPESLSVKSEQNHPIYERFRESQDPHERWAMWNQMVENTKSIPKPRGVEELGPVKVKPGPAPPPAA